MVRLFLNILTKVQGILNGEEGQDLVEYALVTAMIGLVAVTGIQQVASSINAVFSSISTTLG